MSAGPAEVSCDYEERTRIFCHLPLNPGTGEIKVINDFIGYLENLRKQSVNLKGCTKTSQFPPVIEGYWRSSPKNKFLVEGVVLFVIDFEFAIKESRLWQTISEMKRHIQESYLEHTGKRQDEVWIVAHAILRLK